MNLGTRDEDQPIKYFIELTHQTIMYTVSKCLEVEPNDALSGIIGFRWVSVGQSVYIKGVSHYLDKHPGGGYRGYNLICCDDKPSRQRFLGFGLPSDGLTEEQMNQTLVNAHNQPTRWDDKASEFQTKEQVTKAQSLANDTVTKLDPKKNEGFHGDNVTEFKVDLIQDLINLPEEEVSMDFVKKHPSQITKSDNFKKMLALAERSKKFYLPPEQTLPNS